jgi:hypothetical protein
MGRWTNAIPSVALRAKRKRAEKKEKQAIGAVCMLPGIIAFLLPLVSCSRFRESVTGALAKRVTQACLPACLPKTADYGIILHVSSARYVTGDAGPHIGISTTHVMYLVRKGRGPPIRWQVGNKSSERERERRLTTQWCRRVRWRCYSNRSTWERTAE